MLLIRRLKVSDLPALDAIEALRQPEWATQPAWPQSYRRLVERTLEEEPQGIFIAELDGHVAGWAVVRLRGVHPLSGKPQGHLLHLAVSPPMRRRGIGGRLLLETEAYLRSNGCEVVQLDLPAQDAAGAERMKKKGYRVTSVQLERTFKP